MDWLTAHQAQLWSLGTVVFAAIVARAMRLRPRLRYSVGHSWNMIVDEPLLDPEGQQIAPKQVVRTASITVGNSGLQAAKAVEIAFNWKPPIFNVWPGRNYEELPSSQGRFSLRFGSLAPAEQITIHIMSINQDLPLIAAVRSEDSVGKPVTMAPQRVWPAWVGGVTIVLLLLGAAAAVYLSASLLQVIGNSDLPRISAAARAGA
ncbi:MULTISPECIES: hypothetical protein [unclassified Sphingomonas]|uniref:hypothetical protein n=1 Tax=unclassified Sphingomonas TaxID=196159 RepID=UPI00226A434F|nr:MULTISPECIES: hypothetical protein [unclassified Sphingomonas]